MKGTINSPIMTDVAATNRLTSDGQDYEEVIDDGHERDTHAPNTVHQRLRANSSIMKAKKILGM